MARAAKRRGSADPDRFENEARTYHEKLRDGFLMLAASEPERCVLIDATAPRDDVAEQIWRIVNERFDPSTAPAQLEGAN
jgi:dTMP kinase